MVRAAVGLAMALCVVGCGGMGDEVKVRISPAFEADEQEAILRAVDEWQAAEPRLVLDVQIADADLEGDLVRVVRDARGTCGTGRDDVAGNTWHSASRDRATVCLAVSGIARMPAPPAEAWRRTVLHELGHAFGLQHDVPGTVMAADVLAGAEHLTERDRAQFCAVRDGDC